MNVQVLRHGQVIIAAQEQEGGSLSHFEATTALAFRCGGLRSMDGVGKNSS
jgi:hypothetical protein